MSKTMKRPLRKGVAKVPLIMQMEELECGAACLTMVMAYYGKWLPLEQVRRDCGVSRHPYSAKQWRISLHYSMEFQPIRGA